MSALTIRTAISSDWPRLRDFAIELQEYERRLHSTRLPGVIIVDAYLTWMQQKASNGGAVLVAEIDSDFVGFASGWIEHTDNIAETADSNRFGYISDIYVLPNNRGRGIASRLLDALERELCLSGVRRLRICSLAVNRSAGASYEHAGFVPYEIVFEKVVTGGSTA